MDNNVEEVSNKDKCNHQLIPTSIDATTPCYKCVHCDENIEAYANPMSSRRYAVEAEKALEEATLHFTRALSLLIEGLAENGISRLYFSKDHKTKSGSIVFIDNSEFMVLYPDNGGMRHYTPTSADMLASDWYVVQ